MQYLRAVVTRALAIQVNLYFLSTNTLEPTMSAHEGHLALVTHALMVIGGVWGRGGLSLFLNYP